METTRGFFTNPATQLQEKVEEKFLKLI